MKRIFHYAVLFILIGCQKPLKITDYNFSLTAELEKAEDYSSTYLNLTISSQQHTGYKLSYKIDDDRNLKLSDRAGSVVESGTNIDFEDGSISFLISDLKPGEHFIKFTVSNKHVSQSKTLNFKVINPSFSFSLKPIISKDGLSGKLEVAVSDIEDTDTFKADYKIDGTNAHYLLYEEDKKIFRPGSKIEFKSGVAVFDFPALAVGKHTISMSLSNGHTVTSRQASFSFSVRVLSIKIPEYIEIKRFERKEVQLDITPVFHQSTIRFKKQLNPNNPKPDGIINVSIDSGKSTMELSVKPECFAFVGHADYIILEADEVKAGVYVKYVL